MSYTEKTLRKMHKPQLVELVERLQAQLAKMKATGVVRYNSKQYVGLPLTSAEYDAAYDRVHRGLCDSLDNYGENLLQVIPMIWSIPVAGIDHYIVSYSADSETGVFVHGIYKAVEIDAALV